jgi:excisionase family DNA binding protein
MSEAPIEQLYSPTDVAKMFGVSAYTVREWIHDKKLAAVKLPNGHLRISESEITRLANVKYGDT